jgi:hypothetical protein
VTTTKTVKVKVTVTLHAAAAGLGERRQRYVGRVVRERRFQFVGGLHRRRERCHRAVQRRHLLLRRPPPGRLFASWRSGRLLPVDTCAVTFRTRPPSRPSVPGVVPMVSEIWPRLLKACRRQRHGSDVRGAASLRRPDEWRWPSRRRLSGRFPVCRRGRRR